MSETSSGVAISQVDDSVDPVLRDVYDEILAESHTHPPYSIDFDYVRTLDANKRRVFAKAYFLGKYYWEHLQSHRHLGFVFPLRTKDNLVFDPVTGSFVLGSKKKAVTTRNERDLRTIGRILAFNDFILRLIAEGRTKTQREVFYSFLPSASLSFGHQEVIKDHKITFELRREGHKKEGPIASAEFITMMESLYGVPHEALGIFPDETGHIFGDAELQYTYPPTFVGKSIRLDSNPNGQAIGYSLSSANITFCNAERIIIIEKESQYQQLIYNGIDKKYKALLVHFQGTGSSAVKLLVKKLVREGRLQAYIVTDGDVWGLHIARTFIIGSVKSGHLKLAIPTAKFLGITPGDIVEYDLPSSEFDEKATSKVRALLDDPRYQDPIWKQFLLDYQRLGKSAELEAFSARGSNCFVDEYLPAKIEQTKI
jgi:DNA topoisomerase-6 subunit A